MNRQEFSTIASILKKAYGSDRVMPDQEAIDVWYGFLKDVDYSVMKVAVSEYIATSKFPPAISELRELTAGITSKRIMPWDMAWGTVLTAIRYYGYYREAEAIASMDEVTSSIVKRMGYPNICLSENIEVERANFRMAYENEAKSRKQSNMLPGAVKKEKQLLTDRFVGELAARLEYKERSEDG